MKDTESVFTPPSGEHEFLKKFVAPGIALKNGAMVSYQDGKFLSKWFNENVIVDATKLDTRCVLEFGLQEAIHRLLADHAPVSQAEYALWGHKTLGVNGSVEHWVSRLSRIYPAPQHRPEWTLNNMPKPHEFSAVWEDGLIRIESVNDRRIAHESAAYGTSFLQSIIRDEFTITEDTSIAVFEKPTRAILVGHHKFIERLCAHTAYQSRPIIATDIDMSVR